MRKKPVFKILSGIVYGKVIPALPDAPVGEPEQAKSALVTIVTWMVGVFWVVAVALIIWAAFLYLTAGGSEERIKEAKARLLYAVIAAAIALLANGVNIIVENALKGA